MGMSIRLLAREDCEAIRETLVECSAFSDEEVYECSRRFYERAG
jgi:hypothetical protein